MDLERTVRWVWRCAWVAPCVLLSISLVDPAVREVYALHCRVLLRLNGSRTVAQGRSVSVQFSREFAQECRTAAASSPDAYLIAEYADCGGKVLPNPMAWTWHPLTEWGLLLASDRVHTQCFLARYAPTPRPTGQVDALNRQINATLEAIRCAQVCRPDSGSLSLAEALMLFDSGCDTDALDALRMAGRKRWNAQSGLAFQYLRALLQGAGLPAVQAVCAARQHAQPGPLASVIAADNEHLGRMMERAVDERDDATFASLLELISALRSAGEYERPHLFRYLYRRADDLRDAMAGRLGIQIADSGMTHEDWQFREAQREHAFDMYVGLYGPPGMAGQIRDEEEKLRADAEVRYSRCDERSIAFGMGLFKSELGGGGSLILLALLVAGVALEIVIVRGRADRPRAEMPPPVWFWGLVPLVCAGMILCVFGAVDSVVKPGDVRIGSGPPILSATQHSLLVSFGLCILFLIMRTLGLLGQCICRITLFVFSLVYVGVVSWTAQWREEVIRAAEAMCVG